MVRTLTSITNEPQRVPPPETTWPDSYRLLLGAPYPVTHLKFHAVSQKPDSEASSGPDGQQPDDIKMRPVTFLPIVSQYFKKLGLCAGVQVPVRMSAHERNDEAQPGELSLKS